MRRVQASALCSDAVSDEPQADPHLARRRQEVQEVIASVVDWALEDEAVRAVAVVGSMGAAIQTLTLTWTSWCWRKTRSPTERGGLARSARCSAAGGTRAVGSPERTTSATGIWP